MRGRIGRAAALSLAAACLLTGCGDQGGLSPASGDDASAASRPAKFGEQRVTWAQARTLHYGGDTFTLPGKADSGLWRTPYGFIVSVKETAEPGGGTLTWFDGRTATPLEGDPVGVRVSPDGRYAGWIDYDGPKRPVGRLAEVVVVDLSTGAEVFRNHDDMGGADDDLDNLYEDAGLGFRGFDDDYVYWETAEGSPTSKRARIGDWQVEPDPAADPDGPPPSPRAYDSLLGLESGLDDDGTLSETGEGLVGLASPAGRWCVTTGEPGPLPVVDCRTTHPVTPDYPARKNFFAGWTGPSTYAVVSADWEVLPVDGGGGPTPGQISECTLPAGACRPVVRLADVRTVVAGIGDNSQLGG